MLQYLNSSKSDNSLRIWLLGLFKFLINGYKLGSPCFGIYFLIRLCISALLLIRRRYLPLTTLGSGANVVEYGASPDIVEKLYREMIASFINMEMDEYKKNQG